MQRRQLPFLVADGLDRVVGPLFQPAPDADGLEEARLQPVVGEERQGGGAAGACATGGALSTAGGGGLTRFAGSVPGRGPPRLGVISRPSRPSFKHFGQRLHEGSSISPWIGHTDAAVWDLERDPPALLRPGALVRFVELEP